MARTHGHGNPKWTRDEVILALALYWDCDGKMPSARDKRVADLSTLLRQMPYHIASSKRESFRNVDSVMFKLQNIRQVATGRGLGNVSRTDRSVWAEFQGRRDDLDSVARKVRKSILVLGKADESYEDSEVTFKEGRLLTLVHYRLERNRKLRARVLQSRRRSGRLQCECCKCKSAVKNSPISDSMFEVHHRIAISLAVERRTSLADVAVLCANCHRMLHSAIADAGHWLSVEEGRKILLRA